MLKDFQGYGDKAPSLEDRASECEPIYSNNHIIWSTNRGWSGGGRGGRRLPGPSSDELIYQARKLKQKLASSKKKNCQGRKKKKLSRLI